MEAKINIHTILKIVLKLLELICVITAISLTTGHEFPIGGLRGTSFFGDGTLMLAIILTPILLFFAFFGNKEGFLFDASIDFVLGVFMIATGGIGIQFWNSIAGRVPDLIPKARGMGAMCIIGGFFYLADCVHSFIIFKSSE